MVEQKDFYINNYFMTKFRQAVTPLMTNTLLLVLGSLALIPLPVVSLNSSLVLEDVRNILKHVEETPDNIFELELALAKMEGRDRELLNDAAELAKGS